MKTSTNFFAKGLILGFTLIVLFNLSRVSAQTFTVNSLGDGGTAWASTCANATAFNAGTFTEGVRQLNMGLATKIVFSVTGTIDLTARSSEPIRICASNVTIEGSPGVIIQSTLAWQDLISIEGNNDTIKNLDIRGQLSINGGDGNYITGCTFNTTMASRDAVYLYNGATLNTVITNTMLGVSGTTTGMGVRINGATSINNSIKGNTISLYVNGIKLESTGINRFDGNIIYSNAQNGVFADGPSSNLIFINNKIGTDATGNIAKGNNYHGIKIEGGSGHKVGMRNAGNQIVANGNAGPLVTDINNAYGEGIYFWNVTNSSIKGNKVGVNALGNSVIGSDGNSLGNHLDGIFLEFACSGDSVGGILPGEENISGGNGFAHELLSQPSFSYPQRSGIYLISNSGANSNNVIIGNYCGTNASGDNLGNRQEGITLNGTVVSNNTLSGNSCCYNSIGIAARWGASNNTIMNNYVGTLTDGLSSHGNTNIGISLENGAVRTNVYGNIIKSNGGHGVGVIGSGTNATIENNIGGLGAGQGNTITNNGGNGVDIFGTVNVRNTIRGNAISCNTGMGIKLNYGADQGNGGLASPVINSNNTTASHIDGTATANSIIDLYYVPTSCARLCDNVLKQEGLTYITSVTADASGNWEYNTAMSGTVTATANNGLANGYYNTSEFATCNIVCIPPANVDAGPAQTLCATSTSATLAGSLPGGGESGEWSRVGGTMAAVTITSITSNTSTVTGLTTGTLILRWTVSSGACSTSDDVTITVNPANVDPSSATVDRDNFCTNDVGNITLTAIGGSGETLQWYTSSCGGTSIGTGTPLTIPSPTASTTYYARWETTSCANSACASVSVTVAPVNVDPTSASVDRTDFCSDDAGNITLTAVGGSGGILNWYSGSCGGTLVGTGTPLTIASPAASTTYYARWESSVSPGCTSSGCASINVNVNSVPTDPVSAGVDRTDFCETDPGNITLTTTGGTGGTLTWYSGSCGGTVAGTGTPLVIASPAATTTYYARWEAIGCASSLCVNIPVTVNPVPVDPTSASVDRNDFCVDDAGDITLSASGGSGGTLNWYSGSCGGTFVGTGSPLTIASPTASTTYFARWETTGCASSLCASIAVNVAVSPVEPSSATVDRNNFCADDAGDITLTATGGSGTTLNWYSASCGGTLVGTGTPLVIASPAVSTTYFARWEAGGVCANSLCASISVIVNPVTSDPVSASVDRDNFCADDAGDITLTATGGSGSTLSWYSGSCGGTLVGTGTPLVIASPVVSTTYFARWESTGCANSACVSVPVTVNPLTSDPASASVDRNDFCSDDAGNITLTATGGSGGTLNWYSGFCGGTLEGAGAIVVIASPAVTTTYFARWETTGCANSACASITVNVNSVPVDPVSVSVDRNNFCDSDAGDISLTATGGSGSTLTWYSGSCGGTSIGTGSPLVIASPVTSTTYFARWETPGCANSLCESVAVNVNANPLTSSISGPDPVCPNTTGATYSVTTNAGSTYAWTFPSGWTVVGTSDQSSINVDIASNASAGNVTVVETTSGGCSTLNPVSLPVTLNPLTVQPDAGDDRTICSGPIELDATSAGIGTTGLWTENSGTLVFNDDTDPTTSVDGFTTNTTLTWTVTGPCGVLSDDMIITLGASDLLAEAEAAQDTICVGSPADITVTVTGTSATPPYTYTWTSSDGSVDMVTGNASITVNPSVTGWVIYSVNVVDANGCAAPRPIEDSVYAVGQQALMVPNLITPNQDDYNDCLIIRDDQQFDIIPGSIFELYNRWGEAVYKNNHYKNGDFCGSSMADGMYYYSIKTSCDQREIKGWLHIIGNEASNR